MMLGAVPPVREEPGQALVVEAGDGWDDGEPVQETQVT